MKIENVRINGIKNPVGFDLSTLNLSYTVDFRPPKRLTVQIATDKNFENVVDEEKIAFAQSYCTKLHFIPEKEMRYFMRITAGYCVSETAYFETGTDFNCKFITPCKEINHPVLQKQFTVCGEVSYARLYVTGLGLYESSINGKKVGNEFLTPYCNDYDAYVQYQTYDVTYLLKENNRIEIALGNGWYKGRFGLKKRENIFGSQYVAAAKLLVVFKDGTRQEIVTDESWEAFSSSTVSSGIYDGEVRNDTLERVRICGVEFYNKQFNVVPRISLPVVVKQKLSPVLYVSPKGEKILDFGQNFSGVVSFRNFLKCGERLRLAAGEVLQDGCFYRDNLRTAKAEFVYISDGKEKQITPKFTFFGFRYMLVDYDGQIDAADFTGDVLYSDIDATVKISTDNRKINRLLENCMWGQKSNFTDVPTDCPQRDERLGWTGDAQVFSATACYQTYCKAFYDKYLTDIAADQKSYGYVTTYSPAMKEGEKAYSVWGDAVTVIPWNLYLTYGDKDLLAKHFPSMEKYVLDLIEEDDGHGGRRLYNFGFHLGDWLSQDGVSENAFKGATDEYFIASAYYYNSVKIIAESAKVLGYAQKNAEYRRIATEIRRAILDEYFTKTGRLSVDTQTAYALCVKFDIYRNYDRLVEGFKNRIKRDCYKVKGGFVGATQLIQSLISCGLCDEAFRMLYSEAYPGWLHCVNLGATTIWERWNSLNADGSISSTGMNSLNHYSYGAVAEAFYAYIAGLRPISAGYKRVEIAPVFNYRLKKLDFEFLSPCGVYGVKYNVTLDNLVELEIKVPFGAKAVLKTGKSVRKLSGGKYSFTITPEKDLIHPFSADTEVCELLANGKCAEVLKNVIPALYYFLSSSEIGLSGETLRNVGAIQSFYVAPAKMDEIDKLLKQITV